MAEREGSVSSPQYDGRVRHSRCESIRREGIASKALTVLVLLSTALAACSANASTQVAPRTKVGLVMDSGGEYDKGYNEFTLKGARDATTEAGLAFTYLPSSSDTDYERNVEELVSQGTNLIITVGFRMADATAKSAKRHPNVRFAIIDTEYSPGSGCAETARDCYSIAGGLANVTSLVFAEDQLGYLAGVLAACMSESGVVGTVAGIALPPVVRFVTGFQAGAHAVRREIFTLNRYIPDFNDPITGKVVAQGFIGQGVDVIFAVAGNTGNGALLAAKEAGRKAIGVDVDQYYTYPEVKDALLTSASKKVDVAIAAAVKDFAAGKLEPGVRRATLANGGIGLAPYHDWEDKIPQKCKDQVNTAADQVVANPSITGAR